MKEIPVVWPPGTWQISVNNTPVPNPLCIQHRNKPLLALNCGSYLMEKFHSFLLPFFCLFFKASDESLQCKYLCGEVRATCGWEQRSWHWYPASRKLMHPKWAKCENLWHNCGISPGWNPALLSLWKISLMADRPVKTWGLGLFWQIRDAHGWFLPWNWLAQSGDTQLFNSMHAGLRICLGSAHRLTVQAAELRLCTRVDVELLKLNFHYRKQTKLHVIKRSQELSNLPWRWSNKEKMTNLWYWNIGSLCLKFNSCYLWCFQRAFPDLHSVLKHIIFSPLGI